MDWIIRVRSVPYAFDQNVNRASNVRANREESMSKAYRDGWSRCSDPRPHLITRHPFPLRRGMVVNVELPHDLCLRDLRRFVQYLATMCDDWSPRWACLGWRSRHPRRRVTAANLARASCLGIAWARITRAAISHCSARTTAASSATCARVRWRLPQQNRQTTE